MKLASIEKIINIREIPDSQNIEVAQVLGWKVVVKKDEFKIGDLCCYIQIDTIVPDKPEFEFLKPCKFRVRTIKLRGQISQGLIIPIDSNWKNKFYTGDDVTDVIGVLKYSKDIDIVEPKPKMPKIWWKKWVYMFKYNVVLKLFPGLKKVNRTKFPTNLIPITDEERIQNIPQILEEYKGKMFVVSEKLDGSSITIIHEKSRLGQSKFRICSRRFELFNTSNEWYKVFMDTCFKNHILNLVDRFKTNDIIVQGEYIGKPQGNRYKLSSNEIRLFNIFVNGVRLDQDTFYNTTIGLTIPACPLLDVCSMNYDLPTILKHAEGKSLLYPIEREGVVWRCIENPTISFKVISNKFLLKNNE